VRGLELLPMKGNKVTIAVLRILLFVMHFRKVSFRQQKEPLLLSWRP